MTAKSRAIFRPARSRRIVTRRLFAMFKIPRRAFAVAVALSAGVMLTAAGCGRSDFPRTYPLRGKVVFKDGRSLTGAYVEFESTDEAKWRGAANIEENGEFVGAVTSKDGKEVDGLVEAEYRVRIEPGRGDSEDRPAVSVPKRYRDFETSGLKVVIPHSGPVTFELDAKAQ